MKLGYAALSLLLVAAPVVAHDFWIQPMRFQVEPAAPLGFTFQIGHGKFRDRWNNNDRIIILNDIARGGTRNLKPQLRSGGSADLVTSFATPGLHVVAMQTNYAASELPAIRFNDYVKNEGLALILAERRRTGDANTAGRERYSRRAKAMVMVGRPTPTDLAIATRPIGLKLEIVPERNPYALGGSRMLPVRVMYQGRRLPGATVKLTNLEADERPVATAITDRAGRARFRVPATGSWLINVLWGEPIKGDSKADFDTTFSSLTFGYDPAIRPR